MLPVTFHGQTQTSIYFFLSLVSIASVQSSLHFCHVSARAVKYQFAFSLSCFCATLSLRLYLSLVKMPGSEAVRRLHFTTLSQGRRLWQARGLVFVWSTRRLAVWCPYLPSSRVVTRRFSFCSFPPPFLLPDPPSRPFRPCTHSHKHNAPVTGALASYARSPRDDFDRSGFVPAFATAAPVGTRLPLRCTRIPSVTGYRRHPGANQAINPKPLQSG